MFFVETLSIATLLVVVLLSLFFKHFNRDPEREIPAGHCIVSPADGKVLDIVELRPNEPINLAKGLMGRVKSLTDDLSSGPHYLIPIFMDPFNVHVQRIPLSGRVLKVEKRPGKFVMANSLQALENATVETLLDTPLGRIKVLQTAGILVRHIHNHLQAGQEVTKGERFGMIDFGSQVTLILPKSEALKLRVRPGDDVFAGTTILAEYETKASNL